MRFSSPIVSVDWLYANQGASNFILLDATISKITSNENEKFSDQIPNAQFFDLKKKFSNIEAAFPTTFPSAEQFEREARLLGINKNSAIVVYDDKGVYSSPRAWWLFKAFGFNNVAVLDGGLPAWKQAKYPLESKQEISMLSGDFQAKIQPEAMKFFEDIKRETQINKSIIIDARSENRFKGITAEPREGLRSGTIPNSVNLPFESLLEAGHFKSKLELELMYKNLANIDDDLIFSCGSGITACVLALGAELCGYKNVSVYDGSWTEWGSLTDS